MSSVVNIEDYRPHFSIYDPVDNCAHVVPTSLVADAIDGKLRIRDMDESMVRALLRYLLEAVAND